MKKIFWVGCVLAGVALFASCRGESGKTVEGTPIGQGLIIKKQKPESFSCVTVSGLLWQLKTMMKLTETPSLS